MKSNKSSFLAALVFGTLWLGSTAFKRSLTERFLRIKDLIRKDEARLSIQDAFNKRYSLINSAPAKIVIASQCGGDWSCDDEQLGKAFQNHRSYAQKHGYEYVLLEQPLSHRLKVWDRYPLVSALHHRGAEWVLYMDADALFMNPDVSIEKFIQDHTSSKDLIISGDFNTHYQAGVFLMRKSPWTQKVMCNSWKVCPPPGPFHEMSAIMTILGGGNAQQPSTWESAFSRLKGSGVTQEQQDAARKLLPTETDARLLLLPQKAMDSYYGDAWGTHPQLNDLKYQDGDWIVHFAGLSMGQKKDLLPQYASRSALVNISAGEESCDSRVYLTDFNCS